MQETVYQWLKINYLCIVNTLTYNEIKCIHFTQGKQITWDELDARFEANKGLFWVIADVYNSMGCQEIDEDK